MRKRVSTVAAIALILVVTTNPLLAVASGIEKESSGKTGKAISASKSDARRKGVTPPVTGLSGSRVTKYWQGASAAGQTATLLPDGRLLLVGG